MAISTPTPVPVNDVPGVPVVLVPLSEIDRAPAPVAVSGEEVSLPVSEIDIVPDEVPSDFVQLSTGTSSRFQGATGPRGPAGPQGFTGATGSSSGNESVGATGAAGATGATGAAGATGVSDYGNANVTTLLANFGSNTISTTGNITSNGSVSVNSLSVNQTATAWNILGDTLSVPSGGTWRSLPVTLDEYITSANDGYINLQSLYADGNVASQIHLEHGLAQIVVDNGSEYIWAFDDTGNLTLPAGSTILESTYLSASSIQLRPYGGSATQYLEIAPTAVDGDHVHLMAGGTTELFLGDDNQYVKLANTGAVVINSNDNTNTAQWTFDTTGNLTVPGNIIVTTGSVITTPQVLANLTAVAGARAFVSDANLVASGNFGNQISGSGSNTVPAWSDGTNWYIG